MNKDRVNMRTITEIFQEVEDLAREAGEMAKACRRASRQADHQTVELPDLSDMWDEVQDRLIDAKEILEDGLE